MVEDLVTLDAALADFVTFRAAGEEAEGVFRCAECGYGATVRGALPHCPMCRSRVWEAGDRRPASPRDLV